MLTKLLGQRAIQASALRPHTKPAAVPAPLSTEDDPRCLPLRIIHSSGFVECYYMAVPAYAIIHKYRRAILARPEVFRRPWESLVRPDEILTPGEKFYVVPRRTISKLRQQIQRPMVYDWPHSSQSTREGPVARASDGDFSSTLSATVPRLRKLELSGTKPERETAMQTQGYIIKRSAPSCPALRRRVRVAAMWQPSLTVIDE